MLKSVYHTNNRDICQTGNFFIEKNEKLKYNKNVFYFI